MFLHRTEATVQVVRFVFCDDERYDSRERVWHRWKGCVMVELDILGLEELRVLMDGRCRLLYVV